MRLILATVILIISFMSSLYSMNLDIKGGAEIIPIRTNDLRNYNTGYGVELSVEFIYSKYTTTVLEGGYREWQYNRNGYRGELTMHRLGILQYVFPLKRLAEKPSPFLGFGVTFNTEENFRLYILDSDYGGITILSGIHNLFGNDQYGFTPYIRWELDFETDYVYTYFTVGGNIRWRVF